MTAADLKCPLNVADTIAFANHLLKGSKFGAKIIRRKKESGIYNKDSPLVGDKWYMLFQGCNEDVRTTVGANLEQNRNDHMTNATFTMMFDQILKAYACPVIHRDWTSLLIWIQPEIPLKMSHLL